MPRKSRERITPEFPRAPRSRAPAAFSETFPTGIDADSLRISAAAFAIVSDMLVPVSPSGTGKTLRSFTGCLFRSIAAAALRIMFLKSAPVIVFFKVKPPFAQARRLCYTVMESTKTFTLPMGTPVAAVTL